MKPPPFARHPTLIVSGICAALGLALALPAGAQSEGVRRLAGADRFGTAAAISQEYRDSGRAASAVLARSDSFADALAGTPLAVANDGPILLTGSDRLDLLTSDELLRVLDPGAVVYLLGGEAALSNEVADDVLALGYQVERLGGDSRYATALVIAEALGDPDLLLVTTGDDFPDALVAGAAAAANDGAVILTSGATVPPAVADYLQMHPDTERYAVGGPAANAVPGATALAGADRYATTVAVAEEFFGSATAVAVASGTNFPDALSGGAFTASTGAALLLSDPDTLSPSVADYLEGVADTVTTGYVLGGPRAIGDEVLQAVDEAIG